MNLYFRALLIVSLFFQNYLYCFSQDKDSTQSQKDSLTIIGVGDVMLGTHFPSVSYLPPNDGKNILDSVKTFLQNADVTFGNLEGTFVDEGGEVKKCNNPAICYAFKMPTHYVNYLTDAGFDVMSTANNHVGDFGESGRKNTASTLTKAGINFAGLLAYPTTVFERNGVKYGMCAFSPNTGTLDIKDIPAAAKIVAELSTRCDIVIVSFHGGAEGSKMTHVPKKTELFLGEDRGNVYAFSHAMIDAGADVVYGHGPHVTRAVETYKGRFIAYSMGNFCTYGRFNLLGVNGIAPIVKVFINRQGEFQKAQIVSIKQKGEGIPVVDKSNWVYKEMKRLTQEDFPNTPLIFTEDNEILKK
ncbi:MAG TPA: CapA family protein [Cytophagaceae bacterium]|nr:CapA family protein [Cytophagaceae bacterium]